MNNNKNMSARGGSVFGGKKILFTISLAALGVIVLAMPALAATTVSFSPASVNVVSGKSFNVVVAVNPQGASNYTEKIELDYPADLLQVKSFSLGSNWMALSQTGYDLIDNTNGKLIKTAGYPGGISSSATFGTVSFYAKKAGSGTIKLGNGSLALDANNQNVLSGTPSVSVAITAPVSVPAAPSAPAAETPAETEQPAEQPVEQPIAQTPQPTLLAAIGGVLTLGTGSILLGILVGLIILAIIVYVIYLLRKRKNSGN